MKEEFDRLFSSLFVNPEAMKSIVTELGRKNMGLTRQELLQKTGMANSGEFSRMLEALRTGSFITRYRSFGSHNREEFYKLTDPFCLFWLKFVSERSDKKKNDWVNLENTASVMAWKGYILHLSEEIEYYTSICRKRHLFITH